MKSFVAAAAAAAMLGQAQAQQPDTFCLDLERIVEAALDEPAFHNLEAGRAAPPTLGFRSCFVSGNAQRRAWHCHQSLAPDSLSLEGLTARTAKCLPEALRIAGPHDREARFRLPAATIRISESGGPRAHVGRIVTYAVEQD